MPKELTKLIATVILVLGLFAGCSKNNGTTTATIDFMAGSTQENFELTASNASIVNNLYLLTLTATSTGTTVGNIVVNLAGTGPFATGAVFSNAYVSGTNTLQASIEYVPDQTQSVDYITLPLQDSLSRVVVRLTSVTGNTIQGTFSATLVSRTDTTVVGTTLTGGTFYAPFTQPTQ